MGSIYSYEEAITHTGYRPSNVAALGVTHAPMSNPSLVLGN